MSEKPTKSLSPRALKKRARNWERTAQRVYNYRRDLLSADDLDALQEARSELRASVKAEPVDVDRVERAILKLEEILRRTGGVFYPRSSWHENIETLLQAAILALGIRAYFLQPFSIPTNSMYPSYNGMTYEVFVDEKPNILERAFRLVTIGALRTEVTAPSSGDLRLLVAQAGSETLLPRYETAPGRIFFIIPTQKLRLTFLVDNEPVFVDVPPDFQGEIWKIVRDRFFPEDPKGVGSEWLARSFQRKRTVSTPQGLVVDLNERVEEGDTILAFDILTGDKLFVDRMSYHFRKPQVGDPIVFRTIEIDRIQELARQRQRNPNAVDDRFYIKRMVGWEGDHLEIEPPVLLRNGEPINGSEAFEKNNNQVGEYEGYTELGGELTFGGRTLPEGTAFAMGDNSDESEDSRVFGPIPQDTIVGRAIVIYYPFGKRWGLAK